MSIQIFLGNISLIKTYSVTAQYSDVYEGSSVSFTVTVSNSFTGMLDWQLGSGTYSDVSRFLATSGTVAINSGSGSFSITVLATNRSWGTTNFNMQLIDGSSIVATSDTVTIYNVSRFSAPGDYTVEWWQKLSSYAGPIRPFTISTYPTESLGVSFESVGASAYLWETAAPPIIDAAVSASLNDWHHVAVSRYQGISKMFVDGAVVGSNTIDAHRIQNIVDDLTLGGDGVNSNSYITGKLTNFRWTKGWAVYQDTFTPPASPLEVLAASLTVQADTGGGDGNINYTAWKVYRSSNNEMAVVPIGAIVTVAENSGHHGGTYTVTANIWDSPYQKLSVVGSSGTLDTNSAMFNNAPFICHWHEAKLLLLATDSGNVVVDSTNTHTDGIQGGSGISWDSDTPFISPGIGGSAVYTGGPSSNSGATYATYNDARFGSLTDYTMECWFKPSSYGIYQGLFGFMNDPRIEFDPSGIWGRLDGLISSGNISNPTINHWHHIAVQRSGSDSNNTVIYIDGQQVFTRTTSDPVNNGSFDIGLGSMGTPTAFNGKITNVRVSNIARYIDGSNVNLSSFTPPTTVFTPDVNCLLIVTSSNSGNITTDFSETPITVNYVGVAGTATTSYYNTTGISNPETKLDIQNAAYIPGMFAVPIGATATNITESYNDTVMAAESPTSGDTRFDRYFTLQNHTSFTNGESWEFSYLDTSHANPTFSSDNPFIGPLNDSGSMVFDGVSRLHYPGSLDWAIDTDIITDGLILYLDASNANSYSGSGTTWVDLSPSQANATSQTISTPIVFNSAGDASYFSFPGNNDTWFSTDLSQQYVDFTAVILPDFSFHGNADVTSLFSASHTADFSMRFNNVNGSSNWVLPNPGNPNDWVSTTGNKYIINGTVYDSTNATLSSGWNIIGGYRTNYRNGFTPSFAMQIGDSTLGQRPFQGGLAVLLAYNRVLTIDEQKQNFNALRSRFSL